MTDPFLIGGATPRTTDSALTHRVENVDHEVLTSSDTVWVNDVDGMCIGRFGPSIIDVHHGSAGQMAGKHCLACRPRTGSFEDDWAFFASNMKRHHGVALGDDSKPLCPKTATRISPHPTLAAEE